ncbi:translocation/assembly module TamB domain-containing protein [Gimibacter soli]|uniref:Translocation/assembly module TamB domain-containing protein n=1 Tax=Gimibacter soli TaxID=3024400 RepID=A0AAE9XQE4_9PROT|nr:translocation/assembly module TamB domain-containing protein [Gimibacter soli]WCL55287.1 translocation/assembly module TamB domain-containing protein [Gimibacter soli]
MSAAETMKAPSRLPRLMRRLTLALGILLLLAAGGVTGGYIWLRTPPGLDWLARTLSSRFDSETLDIEIASLQGDPFTNLTAQGLTIADANGIWLDAPELRLDWSPVALLTDNRLEIAALDGAPMTLNRMPKGGEKAPGGPLLPALPFGLQVGQVDLDVRFEENTYSLQAAGLQLDPETLAGRLTLAADGTGDRISLAISEAEAGAITIDGGIRAEPDGLVAELGGIMLERAHDLTLAAKIDGFNKGAGTLALSLHGDDVALAVNGPFNLAGKPLLDAADIRVMLPAVAREDIRVSSPLLTGKLTLTRTRLDLAWQFAADALVAKSLALEKPALEGTLGLENGLMEGAIRAQDQRARLMDRSLTLDRLDAVWRADLDDKTWSFSVSDLASNWLTAKGLMARGQGADVAVANGTVTLLPAFLAEFGGGQITGGRLDVALSAEPAGSGFAFTVNGTGDGLKLANPRLAALIGDAPRLELKAAFEDGRIDFTDALLTAPLIAAKAAGAYDTTGQRINLAATVELKDMVPLTGDAVELPDGLTVTLSADGPVDALDLQVSSSLARVEGYGITLSDVQANATLNGGAKGNFTLTAQSRLGPVGVTSPFDLEGGISLPDIRLKTPLLIGKGSLSQPEGGEMAASMQFNLAKSSETVRGSGHIDATYANGKVTATLAAEKLRILVPGRFPIRLRTAEGSFDLDLTGAAYAGTLKAEGFVQGAQRINRIDLSADSTAATPIQLAAAGNWVREFSATLGLNPAGETITANLKARYGEMTAETPSPLVLTRGENWTLDIPDLMLAGGTVRGQVMGHSGNLPAIRLSANGLDLTALNLLAPGLVAGGTLSAEIDTQPSAEDFTGTLKLTLAKVSLLSGDLVGPDAYDMQLEGTATEGTLNVAGRILQGAAEQGRITARLPYQVDGAVVRLDGNAPVAARLDWKGDITPLWALARRPDHYLGGDFKGTLTLAGTANDPRFDGRISLTNGRYEYERLGLKADITALELTGTQDRVELTRLEATDGEKGKLSGVGAFTLTPDFDFPGSLKLSLADFHVAQLETLDAKASADLSYVRENRKASLTGTIKTGPVRVRMPRELPPSVVEIEVTEVNGIAEDSEAAATAPMQAAPTSFDLKVDIADRFQFSGRGLESEWTGNLQVKGTSADPRITGQMRLKNGTFTFASKRFTLADGRITFSGRKGIDPDLSMRATLPAPGITANMQISGRPSAPSFVLSSTPALPEDEILARILFGRSVSEMSALQFAELAVAAEGLRSGRSSSLTGGIGRRLGLDNLAVISGGENGDETLITGGKYLTDNIYLEVETAPTRNETTTRLKINLTDRLLLESEAGAAPGNRLRLKWFWEY